MPREVGQRCEVYPGNSEGRSQLRTPFFYIGKKSRARPASQSRSEVRGKNYDLKIRQELAMTISGRTAPGLSGDQIN